MGQLTRVPGKTRERRGGRGGRRKTSRGVDSELHRSFFGGLGSGLKLSRFDGVQCTLLFVVSKSGFHPKMARPWSNDNARAFLKPQRASCVSGVGG
jgi:hypothetical protein